MPLCSTEAKFYFVDHDNRKYFDCAKCRRFQISIGAERYLEDVSKEFLDKISERSSQARDGEALVILEASKITNASPQEKLLIELAKKSDLLL